MKTTGLFTLHKIHIDCQLNKPFKFIPFGDVHRDSDMHSRTHWKSFLDRAEHAAKHEKAIFLGMGDYGDGLSTSERIVLSDDRVHDTTKKTLENVYRGVTHTLTNELSFMRGRLIGLLGGNHYYDFGDGNTTDHVLANNLGTKFLGVCSFIRVYLRLVGDNDSLKFKKSVSFDIFAHHGKGGGNLPGSTFNTLEKMSSSAIADIYLMGHDHKKGCISSSPRLYIPSGSNCMNLRQKVQWLGRTGSFLKAYEPGMVSYNVDAARSPAALGWIEFEITPVRRREDGDDYIELVIRGTS